MTDRVPVLDRITALEVRAGDTIARAQDGPYKLVETVDRHAGTVRIRYVTTGKWQTKHANEPVWRRTLVPAVTGPLYQ